MSNPCFFTSRIYYIAHDFDYYYWFVASFRGSFCSNCVMLFWICLWLCQKWVYASWKILFEINHLLFLMFFCCGSRSDREIMFKLRFIECLFYLIYIILWPLFVLAYFYLYYGLLIVFSPFFIIYYYSLVVSAFLRINF